MNLRTLISFSVFCLSLPGTAAAAENTACVPWDPATHSKQSSLVIGEVRIDPRNIFNPDNPLERAWFHRLGNDLHILTKQSTIAAQLIFKPGEHLDLRKLDETERILRSKNYIKEAIVTPVEVCGRAVNVDVTTIDHWTFTPSLSFDRIGGKNTSTTEIEESNIFGYGKQVVLEYDDGLDRTSRRVLYDDPNLFGSFLRFRTDYRDNSDGQGYSTRLELPFYHLDSRQAWGIEMSSLDESVYLYDNGEVFNEFQREAERWSISAGWSKGLRDDTVDRFRAGWLYSDKIYGELPDSVAGSVPQNRTLSYPWVSYQRIRENFVKIPNLTTMDETYDAGIGHRYSILLGAAAQSFGADTDYGILQLNYAANYQPRPNQLNGVYANVASVLGSGYQRNTRFKGGFDWYHFGGSHYIYYLGGHIMHDTHPSLDSQVLLGGDTGLRGYPVRYQAGQSKLLVSAEQRHMYSIYPWRLFQMASAVFIDIGSAWNDDEEQRWLSDVGLGLRIFPTRSTGQTVVHIDLAFPVDAPNDVDSMQFSITTKAGF